jgi:hypothetical protein
MNRIADNREAAKSAKEDAKKCGEVVATDERGCEGVSRDVGVSPMTLEMQSGVLAHHRISRQRSIEDGGRVRPPYRLRRGAGFQPAPQWGHLAAAPSAKHGGRDLLASIFRVPIRVHPSPSVATPPRISSRLSSRRSRLRGFPHRGFPGDADESSLRSCLLRPEYRPNVAEYRDPRAGRPCHDMRGPHMPLHAQTAHAMDDRRDACYGNLMSRVARPCSWR